jgi:hypothetical protein
MALCSQYNLILLESISQGNVLLKKKKKKKSSLKKFTKFIK